MAKPSNTGLVGRQFGRWLVVRFSNIRKSRRLWLCECWCGVQRAVDEYHLIKNRTQSCGCLKREMTAVRRLAKSTPNFINLKIGSVIVINYAGQRHGKAFWQCRCSCGFVFNAPEDDIFMKKLTSCGCGGLELAKPKKKKKSKTHRKRLAARRRNLDKDWTDEDTNLLKQSQPYCVVCLSSVDLTVDHVQPAARGHRLRPGNAVILCRVCNGRKGSKPLHKLPADVAGKIKAAAAQFLLEWDKHKGE